MVIIVCLGVLPKGVSGYPAPWSSSSIVQCCSALPDKVLLQKIENIPSDHVEVYKQC